MHLTRQLLFRPTCISCSCCDAACSWARDTRSSASVTDKDDLQGTGRVGQRQVGPITAVPCRSGSRCQSRTMAALKPANTGLWCNTYQRQFYLPSNAAAHIPSAMRSTAWRQRSLDVMTSCWASHNLERRSTTTAACRQAGRQAGRHPASAFARAALLLLSAQRTGPPPLGFALPHCHTDMQRYLGKQTQAGRAVASAFLPRRHATLPPYLPWEANH
jgi:hypothetical protein